MKKFALWEVQSLDKRIQYEKSLEVEIVRTRAMEQYGVYDLASTLPHTTTHCFVSVDSWADGYIDSDQD